MASKSILLLGLFWAFTLLIASEVAPNDLPETSNAKSVKGLDDAKVWSRAWGWIQARGGYRLGGRYGPGGGSGRAPYCQCGCYHHNYHGECIRCRGFASEGAEDVHPQAKPNN